MDASQGLGVPSCAGFFGPSEICFGVGYIWIFWKFLDFLEKLFFLGFFLLFWKFLEIFEIVNFFWKHLDFLEIFGFLVVLSRNIGGTYRVQQSELHDRLYLT
jgi:hypothetical protein